MPKKGGTLRDFSTSILSENIKKLKGDPLAPLSFLDDVKLLLRKLSKNCKNCKIVRIVRKVDHSELDCRLKKTTHYNSRAFFLKGKGAD